MKRLQILILIFCIALSIPLAYVVVRTYHGLHQEEAARLSYFADTLFDEMEQGLGSIVNREEDRAIDEYNFYMTPSGRYRDSTDEKRSPLSRPPQDNYILGYFQNNPDGSFQTPLVETGRPVPADRKNLVSQLDNANRSFNRKRTTATDRIRVQPRKTVAQIQPKPQTGFAEKYLDVSRSQEPKAHLGQKDKRLEKITIAQALNVAKDEQREMAKKRAPAAGSASESRRSGWVETEEEMAAEVKAGKKGAYKEHDLAESEGHGQPGSIPAAKDDESFQVEVAPLRSVLVSEEHIFVFRRIMINQKIYRQGFVLRIHTFLNHLAHSYFSTQPMARFANLRLRVLDHGREIDSIEAGVSANDPNFVLNRIFPTPFDFLNATLSCDKIPQSAGRKTLNIMILVLAAIFLIGLFAIYQSARTLVDLSERRSQFVSSVTHELKTPLTNIRMYIEMLEQGMAKNPEQEHAYFQIIDSEGARLSRLINNVLDLSKLEKKQRSVDLKQGNLKEIISEVKTIMQEKLKQEGFRLTVERHDVAPFNYDREAMIQVLINLIENSIKFGSTAAEKEITIRIYPHDPWVKIAVSDRGPGIPAHALKKIFDDFYRVDNSLTRNTRGTGIGLALVKKFMNLMGGTVTAANNQGPGCTITLSLPSSNQL
jgi:signal transduction histidine kinase